MTGITGKVVAITGACSTGTPWRGRPRSCEPRRFDGSHVRNHSKFISIDYRFLLVTSANFSWSAENANLEFGILIDNPNLAEVVEHEMREAEDFIFERVPPGEASVNEHLAGARDGSGSR
ncbi:MAG: phospholipase D family protein [Nocardiopsaceae bacterium]|nr:phospholipase D family protein [Nocardiopsaceae bacterium]